MTEATTAKVRRLLADGHVHVIYADDCRTVARVRGDSGVYDVAWLGGQWSCTCASYGPCSHAEAVRLVTTAQPVRALAAVAP